MKSKKILILNQGHTENYGDVAINETVTSFFKCKNFEVDFFPFYSEELSLGKNYKKIPKNILKILYYFPFILDRIVKKTINKNFKELNYDGIIIGGGELLCGHREFNSALYVWTKLARRKNIPVYIVGVSGDEDMPKNLINRNKKALNRCSWIYVRDQYTKDICDKFYLVKAEKGPDVVFGYNKICSKKENKTEEKEGVVCVPIQYCYPIKKNMKLNNQEEYYEYLIELIAREVKDKEKITITSSVQSDNEFNNKFYLYVKDKFPKNEVVFERYKNLNQYIKLVQKSRTVISARMHALILAILNNCTIITVPFKKKLEIFNEEYSMDININKVEKDVLDKMNKLYNMIIALDSK